MAKTYSFYVKGICALALMSIVAGCGQVARETGAQEETQTLLHSDAVSSVVSVAQTRQLVGIDKAYAILRDPSYWGAGQTGLPSAYQRRPQSTEFDPVITVLGDSIDLTLPVTKQTRLNASNTYAYPIKKTSFSTDILSVIVGNSDETSLYPRTASSDCKLTYKSFNIYGDSPEKVFTNVQYTALAYVNTHSGDVAVIHMKNFYGKTISQSIARYGILFKTFLAYNKYTSIVVSIGDEFKNELPALQKLFEQCSNIIVVGCIDTNKKYTSPFKSLIDIAVPATQGTASVTGDARALPYVVSTVAMMRSVVPNGSYPANGAKLKEIIKYTTKTSKLLNAGSIIDVLRTMVMIERRTQFNRPPLFVGSQPLPADFPKFDRK